MSRPAAFVRRLRGAEWRTPPPRALAVLGWAASSSCANADVRYLDPVGVALHESVPPVYDDGELTWYEAKAALMLPIAAPDEQQQSALAEQPTLDPFERHPWLTRDDVKVQVHWTLSNLDERSHDVWVMIEPWNEFARYEPAITVTDDEAVRDFSGIDMLFHLPAVDGVRAASDDVAVETGALSGSGSRIDGTLTFDDMDELSLDLATVFKIVADAEPAAPGEPDPRSTLVNHAFNVRNRSYNSPLLEGYAPEVVPGLVGFDFGVRTDEPATVALEIAVELRDLRGNRVVPRGGSAPTLEPPPGVIASSGSL